MAKVRIVGDGTIGGTHVFAGDVEIEMVRSVSFQVDAYAKEVSTATIVVSLPAVDLEVDAAVLAQTVGSVYPMFVLNENIAPEAIAELRKQWDAPHWPSRPNLNDVATPIEVLSLDPRAVTDEERAEAQRRLITGDTRTRSDELQRIRDEAR